MHGNMNILYRNSEDREFHQHRREHLKHSILKAHV